MSLPSIPPSISRLTVFSFALAAAVSLAGCATQNDQRLAHARAVPAKVKQITYVAGPPRRGPGGPIGSIAGGIAGSTIGGGAAEHFVGAIGGSLVGGWIGSSADRKSPRHYIQRLEVRTDSGTDYQLLLEKPSKLSVGARVFVMVEPNGSPVSLIDSKSGVVYRLK